ncbi:MAG: NAD(+) diphosphatase [Lentisphaeria bacterium]|nr:NAD(+) diphosphatase [Lentisphaeria bacterium]
MFEAVQILKEIFSGVPESDDPVIFFSRQDALVKYKDGRPEFPTRSEVGTHVDNEQFFYLGKLNGQRCFAAFTTLPENISGDIEKKVCRRMLAELPDDAGSAFCRGRKLALWAASHRFCGVCRSALDPSDTDLALICPECGEHYYPQLSPAVIVAITRNNGKELLLAHNRNFTGGFYSLIAGFVEAGETLEAAVEREVMEECGITVGNIRYFTSQVWPFPNSLMLAFTAEYAGGEAHPDGVELSDLGWFTAESHPQLPAPGSVARKVIDHIFGWVK